MANNIFRNKNTLNKLINLRILGFSEVSLGILFNVDRTGLIYHFKKYHIANPAQVYDIPRIVSKLMPKEKSLWIEINGERINQGRSYQEYLELSHRSHLKRA